MIRFVGTSSIQISRFELCRETWPRIFQAWEIEDKRHVRLIFEIKYSVDIQPEAPE